MVKKVFIIILILLSSTHFFAQNENDALRYSFLTHGGTGRYMGMSGAFSALGADFSILSTNPAGIGMFKKSRIVFAPGIISTSLKADYFNETSQDDHIHANINSFGAILNLKSYQEDDSGWRTVAFGVGYNRLRNFSKDITIEATNNNSSYLDLFMIKSDGYTPEELYDLEWLAFDTYATDTIPGDIEKRYIHPLYDIYGENQKKNIQTRGGIGEYVFSLGGNYDDILQIGATFGIQQIHYEEISKFTEESQDLASDFESFNFVDSVVTEGSGFNFKFGMIYRPVNYFRLGLAFHTPTFYTMKDIYSNSMKTNWRTADDNGKSYYFAQTDEYEYNYELYTPFRAVAGVALILSRIGILSADYEYVNYSKARLRADLVDDFEDANSIISENFRAGHNFRGGVEIRLAPIYLRGGISYYSSATSSTFNATGSVKSYSLGIGLKTIDTYIDIAFSHSFSDDDYMMYEYDAGLAEWANLHHVQDQISITLGYKF
ncbi:MAG: hypothetical protein B6I20_07590 [Bacteroidetes bacterium 4572_117]|nr:MAG: hypothetical protein B6I20_07590 [Bacteroidetes bacterium 4572_117]